MWPTARDRSFSVVRSAPAHRRGSRSRARSSHHLPICRGSPDGPWPLALFPRPILPLLVLSPPITTCLGDPAQSPTAALRCRLGSSLPHCRTQAGFSESDPTSGFRTEPPQAQRDVPCTLVFLSCDRAGDRTVWGSLCIAGIAHLFGVSGAHTDTSRPIPCSHGCGYAVWIWISSRVPRGLGRWSGRNGSIPKRTIELPQMGAYKKGRWASALIPRGVDVILAQTPSSSFTLQKQYHRQT